MPSTCIPAILQGQELGFQGAQHPRAGPEPCQACAELAALLALPWSPPMTSCCRMSWVCQRAAAASAAGSCCAAACDVDQLHFSQHAWRWRPAGSLTWSACRGRGHHQQLAVITPQRTSPNDGVCDQQQRQLSRMHAPCRSVAYPSHTQRTPSLPNRAQLLLVLHFHMWCCSA